MQSDPKVPRATLCDKLRPLSESANRAMTLDEFLQSLAFTEPPPGVGAPLAALWRDAKDDWDAAHRLAQSERGQIGAWVHAYLHRKEGDLANASYWYRRAEREMPPVTLEEEWAEIAATLLAAER